MIELGVNVDHVATVRQARRTYEPDPVWAAIEAHLGGADGITVHLREDRRHIQDEDVRRLRELTHIRLNLEMAATDEMTGIASKIKPEMAMLVPEGRHVFPFLTARENLELGGFKHRRDAAKVRRMVDGIFDMFPRLRERTLQAACLIALHALGGERAVEQALERHSPAVRRRVCALLDDPASANRNATTTARLARAIESSLPAPQP